MKNLAGNKLCDETINRELYVAGIGIHIVEQSTGEVPYSIIGKHKGAEFTRAWYYWCVECRIPENIALEIYNTEIGKMDVRVAGHCGCPAPEDPYLAYYDEYGNKLLSHSFIKKERKSCGKSKMMNQIMDKIEAECRAVDNVKACGVGYVTSYHIDSQEGLNLLAQTMRTYNIGGVR